MLRLRCHAFGFGLSNSVGLSAAVKKDRDVEDDFENRVRPIAAFIATTVWWIPSTDHVRFYDGHDENQAVEVTKKKSFFSQTQLAKTRFDVQNALRR